MPNSSTPKSVLSQFLNSIYTMDYKAKRLNSNLQHLILNGVADTDNLL